MPSLRFGVITLYYLILPSDSIFLTITLNLSKFGLSFSPATFQRLMVYVMRDLYRNNRMTALKVTLNMLSGVGHFLKHRWFLQNLILQLWRVVDQVVEVADRVTYPSISCFIIL